MKKLRIALCGCMGHVEKFGDFINSFAESEIAAVWGTDPEREKELAEHFHCVYEEDYHKLMSGNQLDGVIIVAENALHKELVLEAAQNGLHIFVEKPLCVSLEDANEIRDAVNRAGVCFYMTDPFVRNAGIGLKQMIAEGKLGDITGATFHLGTPAVLENHVSYRKDRDLGGIMADVGGHTIHEAHYLFGKPEKVSATLSYITDKAKENDIEENALIAMSYPDGKLVSLECSWLSGTEFSLQMIYGTKGFACITRDPEVREQEILTYKIGSEPSVTLEKEALPPSPTRHIRYWVEMITKHIPNEMVGIDPLSNQGVSLDNAVEYAQIIEAIYQSSQKGGAAVTLL